MPIPSGYSTHITEQAGPDRISVFTVSLHRSGHYNDPYFGNTDRLCFQDKALLTAYGINFQSTINGASFNNSGKVVADKLQKGFTAEGAAMSVGRCFSYHESGIICTPQRLKHAPENRFVVR